MIELLLLSHLLNRQQRDDDADDVGLLVLLALPAIMVFMPYLVWAAARDHGVGRWEAALWVSVALASVWAVAVLVGPWWAVVTVFVLALAALAAIAVIARVNARLKTESWGYNRDNS